MINNHGITYANTWHSWLRGQALAMLQHKLKDVTYLIVDEISMLGQNMMAWVDKRLRQAKTHLDIPFGGISVILIGGVFTTSSRW